MWSFFSRDPLKDLPYEFGEKVELHGYEEKSIWSLYNGKRKSNGDPVSIFAFDVKNASEAQVQLAKAAFKRLKTLRHPNILTYIDGVETEKSVCIVTEPVVPLETHLQQNPPDVTGPNQLAVSWGLHQLAKALSFLTGDCALVHNNVCTASVFVDRAGEWKLGGVDYMYPSNESSYGTPVKILPALEKYDPPEKTTKKPSEKWSTDMWCLGLLIWEVFNGSFAKTTALKTLGKIPKSLVSQYCELVGANPKSRPSPTSFIESCRTTGGFMDNKFVSTMLFLEEIQIKDQESKTQFFNSLSASLESFPTSFCTQKILPQLIHAYEYGNAGSAVLAPLFKLGKLLETEDYQKRIVPCVVKLFSSTDRATRVKLLQQIEHFVEHLTPSVVNDQIFPSIATGFMDSNPVVREQTIKSMLHLAGKLNYKNLNEELLKHFARLQSRDDQGGIRTNTTVCLGKIACHLHPQVRQRVLSSAYLRSIKDPFPPARQAGILAMAATHNFFTLQESSMRLLPALCTLTMDPDKAVRDQAFRAIKCYLGKLEKVSENPDLISEAEKDVNTGGTSASGTAGWTGWAVSGMTSITSKIYRGGNTVSKTAAAKSKPVATATAVSKPVKTGSAGNLGKVGASAVQESKMAVKEEVEELEEEEEEEPDIWDDAENWGEMEKVDSTGGREAASHSAASASTNQKSADGWDDDGAWDSIEDDDDDNDTPSVPVAAPPTNKTTPASTGVSHTASDLSSMSSLSSSSSMKPSSSGRGKMVADDEDTSSIYNWNKQPSTNDDDFFNSLIDSKPTTRKPQSSLSVGRQSSASGDQSQKTSAARGGASATSSTSRAGSKQSASTTNRGWDEWSNDEWGKEGDGWGDDSDWGSSPQGAGSTAGRGAGGRSRGKPLSGSRT